MEQHDDRFLSISEFASLMNTNRKTLLFYDSIDLLKPAYIAPNGYRYYLREQVDEATAIKTLSEIGVPLKSARQYLDSRDIQSAASLLARQKEALEERIEYLHFVCDMIDIRMETLEEGTSIESLIELTEEKDFVSFRIINRGEEIPIFRMDTPNSSKLDPPDSVRSEYYHVFTEMGIPFGFPFGYLVDNEHLLAREINEAQGIYFRVKKESRANSHIPAGTYLVSYDHTPYGQTAFIYERLFDFAEQKHLTITGDAYEEYQIDELVTVDTQKYLAKIMLKVK